MNGSLTLGWLDGSILVLYVVVLASIGTWAARRTAKTTEDYFLASRSIPWFITAMSFAATCISALTFVGTPAEGFSADYRYLLGNLGDILATVFVAFVFLPHFQKFKVTSIYEVIARRFGQSARTTCAGYFILTRTLAATVRIVAIAKVLEVVSGGSISYAHCVVIVVLIILSYTTIGGGRAIAWTDSLQFVLLVTGAVAGLAYIVHHVPGGVRGIIAAGEHAVKPDGTVYNKFNFLEMYKPSNLGLLALMSVWAFFNSTAAYGTDQDMVQRLLACRDQKKARWSLVGWGLASIPITFLFLSIGVALYAYSLSHPALIAGMKDNDFVFPRFILTSMPHGLRGLLFAAVASAAMGSADSALASLSTAFVIDFYKPFKGGRVSEEHCVRVSRISFVVFGLLFMFFGLTMHRLDRLLWLAFRLIAFTYGPLLGIFAVAIMTDWEVPERRIVPLMLVLTAGIFASAMYAWHVYLTLPSFATPEASTAFFAAHRALAFWKAVHTDYWRLDVVFGSLLMVLGAFLMRVRGSGGADGAALPA
ncbi:MAG: sodium/solute symporter [Elusimicrobia bacterium]|nr:sodium/solute symporter [Elusimicrobiota bacterium]